LQLNPQPELYHEIFGSILDRREMAPYLLRNCSGYNSAIIRATRMMENRGFDVIADELCPGEGERALNYVHQTLKYYRGWLLPFVKKQLQLLESLDSANRSFYQSTLASLIHIDNTLNDAALVELISEDARHLFLLASSARYNNLFDGYKGSRLSVPLNWQRAGCSILKMCHLIKSIEEDSQDIHDYTRLGLFFESNGQSLEDLFNFRWERPPLIPAEEPARRAFAKLATFFFRIKETMSFDHRQNCYIFNSGDGVRVPILEVKARLKSPESMFTKLGKDVEGEVFNIRDVLAITFLLQSREDTLTLFHALQKRGVILQENTVSHSITQTLFDTPADMHEAVQRLMINLSKSAGGSEERISEEYISENANQFYNSLTINAASNSFSSGVHRKFQCKINFSLPIHRDRATNEILVPGTHSYAERMERTILTQQHTLPVEIRIADSEGWEASERRGDAHHDAYKCRQLIALMNRLFAPLFNFPVENFEGLREDQRRLFF